MMKQIYPSSFDKHKPYLTMIILALILCISLPNSSWGQGEKKEDPLNKPAVWDALKEHPHDSLMWSRYFSKPWACFNKKERDQLSGWQNQLAKELDEVVIEANTDVVDWTEEATADAEANKAMDAEHAQVASAIDNYIARLEETLVEEKQMVEDLKSNLIMNFFIIDELYQEEFEELGVSYQNYMTSYPKGDYSKEQWVDEKEKELYKLKAKNFQKVKKQILKDARKHRHGNAD